MHYISSVQAPVDQTGAHLAYILKYTTHILHLSGESNKVAGVLSPATINALEPGIDYKAPAETQQEVEEMAAYRTATYL